MRLQTMGRFHIATPILPRGCLLAAFSLRSPVALPGFRSAVPSRSCVALPWLEAPFRRASPSRFLVVKRRLVAQFRRAVSSRRLE